MRKTYTRLRIDLNILNICQSRYGKVSSSNCSECTDQVESVNHFLFHCNRYRQVRNAFIQTISNENIKISNRHDERKLKFLLNLDCPDSLVGACCNYVNKIYRIRESL